MTQGVLRATVVNEEALGGFKQARRPIRVVLIQPSARQAVRSLLPQVDEGGGEGIGFKPPLGILYCASTVKQRSPHEVFVIDAMAEQLDFESLVHRVAAINPDVVGISAWTDFWYPAYRTGELIKQALPHTHLTYGGPHLGIYPQLTLDIPFVDSVIVGDGELPFLYLCNMVANGKIEDSVSGLHFKPCGVKPAPDMFFIQAELDDLPNPDRTLLPIKNYGSVLAKGDLVTTMITSRGCPFLCTFCKLNFQKTLARSAQNILDEFKAIHELGIREVEIYDDTFTWSKKRVIEVCEGLVQADYGITFAVRDRVSSQSVDPDTLRLLYRAGCRRIHYGIESGAQHVIDKMKKRISTEQAKRAVSLAKEAGITVLAYFMFGNLNETREDMKETIDFALSLDADFAQFSITIPYAGTEMYEEALKEGIITSDYWAEYARQPTPDFVPPQLIENMVDRRTMLAMRDEAVRRFYFRPRFILKELASLRSASEFVRKARMGMQLAHSVYTK
jgi:radical SAM superfamily enzyme YgiQ (UPF0313 family)